MTGEADPMDRSWPPGSQALARLLRRGDGRTLGQGAARPQGAKFGTSAAEANWSLRRLVVSTVSVNAVLWVLTALALWWAYKSGLPPN
jgi:hypothetical protein